MKTKNGIGKKSSALTVAAPVRLLLKKCGFLSGTIYKSLQQDRDQADISDIIRQLQAIVDEAIEVKSGLTTGEPGPDTTYDISRIDFDRLRKEFERSKSKRTTVQNLKQVVESRLRRLMERNPLRTDLQLHYEQIVAEYNREKDRAIIEQTFEC